MYEDEKEIDLGALFGTILQKWWMIGLAGLICAAAGFAAARFVVKPTYKSTTAVYVVNRQDNSSVTYSDLQLGSQLTKDYIVLAKGRAVLEGVIEHLGLSMTTEQLSDALSVATASDTRIMYITATASSPLLAQQLADTTRDLAAVHIKEVMNIEEINVAETANYPTKKASPSITKWTLLGGVLGVFAVVAVLTLRFLLDDKIKTSEDVEQYLGLSTLGTIPYSEILEKQEKQLNKKKRRTKRKCRKSK